MADTQLYDSGDGVWGLYRLVQTPVGTFRAQYYPGNYGEVVRVHDPQGQEHNYHTPGLVDLQLADRGGEVVIEWSRIGDGGSSHRPVMATTTGLATTGATPTPAPAPKPLPAPAPPSPTPTDGPASLQTLADRIGHYDPLLGETVRTQLDSMEAQLVGFRADNAYIANQNRALATAVAALQPPTPPKPGVV